MDHSSYADIELKIAWASEQAAHLERHFFQGINFWRDFFPGALGEALVAAKDGEWVTETMPAADIIPRDDAANVMTVAANKMMPIGRSRLQVVPQPGRFYPRSIIAGTAGVTAEEYLPLRILAAGEDGFTVDLNHPLAKHELEIGLRVVGERYIGKEERGGRCNDVVYESLLSGVGMQQVLPHSHAFAAADAFARVDESDDAIFYQQDRLINHIDSECSRQLAAIYARHLRAGMKVLDLMSSYESHLPNTPELDVTGLGMNRNEMQANPRLARHIVHDLNQNPRLPFAEHEFDVVLCSLAIEYLLDPLAVLREVVRVSKPGGCLLVSFSDRWFPPKVIAIWQQLHPFERLGMVLHWLLKTARLNDIKTETVRGLLRPQDDKYADKMLFADPLFVLTATVAAE